VRIGVFGDTHDHLIAITRALALFEDQDVEAIIHTGDFCSPFALKLIVERSGVPLVGVYGNNDGERRGLARLHPDLCDGPRHVELGGRKLCLIHDAKQLAHEDEMAADIVISGHTHGPPVCRVTEGRLDLYPGECCGWLTGIGRASVLDTEAMAAHNHVVLEQERSRP